MSTKKNKTKNKKAAGATQLKRSTFGEEAEMVKLLKDGTSRAEICRRFGIGLRTMACIKSDAPAIKKAVETVDNGKAKVRRTPFCPDVCCC